MAAEAAGRDAATVRPAECNEMEERVRCPFGQVGSSPGENVKKNYNIFRASQAFLAARDALSQRDGEKPQGAQHRCCRRQCLRRAGLEQSS